MKRRIVQESLERPVEGNRVRVLSIAGSGRSGSTILGRTLAEIPGWIFCGELRLGFFVLAANRLCGCGRPSQECEFWRAVIEHGFGTFDRAVLERAAELSGRVALNRHAMFHLSPLRPIRFRHETVEYASIAAQIYRSILAVSGGEMIVDTSKYPAYYLALRENEGIDLRTIHLVRDSRAVAFSNKRKNLAPGDPKNIKYMPVQNPMLTAMAWNLKNAFVDIAMFKSGRSTLLRYEDFIADPVSVVGDVVELLGSERCPPDISRGVIEMGTHHSLAGNPMRFDRGTVQLRLDDEWRSEMKRSHHALVTALTWPMLFAYGYLGRSPQPGEVASNA